MTTSCTLVHLLLTNFSANSFASSASTVEDACFWLKLARPLLLLLALLSPTPGVKDGGISTFDIRDVFIFFSWHCTPYTIISTYSFGSIVLGGGGSISIMAVLSGSGRCGHTYPLAFPDSFEGMCAEAYPVTLPSMSSEVDMACCWLMCDLSSFSIWGLLLCLSPNKVISMDSCHFCS